MASWLHDKRKLDLEFEYLKKIFSNNKMQEKLVNVRL